MYRWNNDYNHGAHPAILQALQQTNQDAFAGYGLDEWCKKGSLEIKKYLGRTDVDIHFLLGGTQANYTLISHALRPWQSAVCADCGHINSHEIGALEHAGIKILTAPAEDGKLSAKALHEIVAAYRSSDVKEHITEPKLVYLSFPSELGTVYSKAQLQAIKQECVQNDLLLFIDGARMGYGLGAAGNDVDLKFIASLTDAFYLGGTKCGALFGEALVIVNDALKKHFRASMKQNGGMLAKGWLLGLQFYTLFADGLYFEITKKADAQADLIRNAFVKKGIALCCENRTNQIFVALDREQEKILAEKHIFENEGYAQDGRRIVRFCTSWSTDASDVDALIVDIEKL